MEGQKIPLWSYATHLYKFAFVASDEDLPISRRRFYKTAASFQVHSPHWLSSGKPHVKRLLASQARALSSDNAAGKHVKRLPESLQETVNKSIACVTLLCMVSWLLVSGVFWKTNLCFILYGYMIFPSRLLQLLYGNKKKTPNEVYQLKLNCISWIWA